VFGSCSDFRENVRISGGSDSQDSSTINESAAISALGVTKLLAVKSGWTEKNLFPKRQKHRMFGSGSDSKLVGFGEVGAGIYCKN